MRCLVLFLVLVVFMAAVPSAPAQNYGSGDCFLVRYNQPFCYCIGFPSYPYGETQGYSECTEHNPCRECYGPGWCETSGSCSTYLRAGIRDSRRVLAKEQDSIAILDFLVEFKKMTKEQRSFFVAAVDEKVGHGLMECEIEARHDAYRAKFKELMGVELQPGYIPVPPSRTKNPAPIPPVIASIQ